MPHAHSSQASTLQTNGEVLQEVARAIEQLRFGSIEITVHDGRVTQIERREKVRFNQSSTQETQRFTPTVKTAATL